MVLFWASKSGTVHPKVERLTDMEPLPACACDVTCDRSEKMA